MNEGGSDPVPAGDTPMPTTNTPAAHVHPQGGMSPEDMAGDGTGHLGSSVASSSDEKGQFKKGSVSDMSALVSRVSDALGEPGSGHGSISGKSGALDVDDDHGDIMATQIGPNQHVSISAVPKQCLEYQVSDNLSY
ncbi:hypothetical protein N7457_004695 [Penicillium paradoxum]|uniref:uncharacterized protein n=1 Tax=Penicillium paradoxum TaxID=176176 RepID=UPI002548AB7C|nr:uncharacterized protein N7457_004695 [Penicillium paradoxum]KAJ5782921.1 hypothetical protein N7457_004695 [Penicillium paradoxum]